LERERSLDLEKLPLREEEVKTTRRGASLRFLKFFKYDYIQICVASTSKNDAFAQKCPPTVTQPLFARTKKTKATTAHRRWECITANKIDQSLYSDCPNAFNQFRI